jgi:mannose-6-phosphate isomerase-like protein (cupin superfamily)
MRIYHLEPQHPKGWFAGPWNSNLTVAIGYANSGIDEPHLHTRITEVYLVGCGQAEIQVERRKIFLQAGDVIIIEPGEAHTFLSSSPDYFHFVIHTPGLPDDEARRDKISVDRGRMGVES